MLKKKRPNWLSKQSEFDKSLSYSYIRSIRYYNQLYHSNYEAHQEAIKSIYKEAKALRREGHDVHVDHIVPIMSDIVCGLHVPWNLEIIPAKENMRKSNLYWPFHPFENLEFDF